MGEIIAWLCLLSITVCFGR